jgi:hypothetical protein
MDIYPQKPHAPHHHEFVEYTWKGFYKDTNEAIAPIHNNPYAKASL